MKDIVSNIIVVVVFLVVILLGGVWLLQHPVILWIYLVLDVLAIIIYIVSYRNNSKNNVSIHTKFEFFGTVDKIMIYIFPIPFIFIKFFHHIKKNKIRNKKRRSKSGEKMKKVNKQYVYKFLNIGQMVEFEVKSVEFDVWITKSQIETNVIPIINYSSLYKECSSCGFRTYKLISDKEIEMATYSNYGTGEKKFKCKNCSKSHVETYTIEILRYDDSDNSSRGGSSSSSGGGRSWSGGESSGGGSSSGW